MFSYPFRFPYPHQRGPASRLGAATDEHRRASHAAALALGVVLAASALLCLAASSAQAALLSTGACNGESLSEPFARWGDTSPYELASQGDFEGSLSQWTLGGDAGRTAGSETFGATGTVGAYSLKLPAGGWAQSPYTCVNASYPTFRFFARGGLLSTISVAVVYKTALGTVALPLGVAVPGGSWQPTAPMLTGSVVAGLLSGGTAQAALRFTALTGSSQVDDVYIDCPVPIGFGQTISQPYIVAWMVEQLRLTPESRVLEVGAGCGYQTAILARLAREVFAVEIIDTLTARARATLDGLGVTNVQLATRDGSLGCVPGAPAPRPPPAPTIGGTGYTPIPWYEFE